MSLYPLWESRTSGLDPISVYVSLMLLSFCAKRTLRRLNKRSPLFVALFSQTNYLPHSWFHLLYGLM
ncbi:hypothetical protein CsSME_00008031 [Camellia sinensis var. sinensis]